MPFFAKSKGRHPISKAMASFFELSRQSQKKAVFIFNILRLKPRIIGAGSERHYVKRTTIPLLCFPKKFSVYRWTCH